MEKLATAVREGLVLLDPEAPDLPDVLSQVVSLCAARGLITVEQQSIVLEELLSRQQLGRTAIGRGVAIPHAYVEGIPKAALVIVRLKRPIDMAAADGVPIRHLFVLIGPTGQVDEHLDTMATISRMISDNEVRYGLSEARSPKEVGESFQDYARRTASYKRRADVGTSPGLTYSGRLFGGLASDIRRRGLNYAADFRDGLRPKCLTATLFLYFACLAPAVTFGGLMFGATGGTIGATEMLVATAACGIVFALLSGQPLIILGGTGPLLVFTGILYQLCDAMQLPFLECYVWVGLWTGLFTFLLAATDASCLVRYFTRFTDEIFAVLISIIFIVEALKSILRYVQEARQADLPHDVAFLSLFLAFGTFIIAMALTKFRNSRYLIPNAREFLADFGPTLAIGSMMAFGLLFPTVSPEPLDVPSTFGTTSGRQWFVPFTGLPWWVCIAAAGPALLVTVLVYLDQNITARLVNNPDHRLHKGEGYHLDLAIVGILISVCSLFGLPWLVAATVRSLNHVRALATVEESVTAAGERHDELVHVRENRLTGLAVHLLIAISLLFLPMLQSVPKAVLYGVFLYMGIVSITGNQLFERVSLWLMDSNLYPRTHYTRMVPLRTLHKFTLIQVICLMLLWLVKTSAVAILFPLFIAILVPVRMLLNRFFKPEHLEALDAKELPREEELEWV